MKCIFKDALKRHQFWLSQEASYRNFSTQDCGMAKLETKSLT